MFCHIRQRCLCISRVWKSRSWFICRWISRCVTKLVCLSFAGRFAKVLHNSWLWCSKEGTEQTSSLRVCCLSCYWTCFLHKVEGNPCVDVMKEFPKTLWRWLKSSHRQDHALSKRKKIQIQVIVLGSFSEFKQHVSTKRDLLRNRRLEE